MLRSRSRSVADRGDGPGPKLFWVKKEEMTKGKKPSSASKSRPPSLSHMYFCNGCYMLCSHSGCVEVVHWDGEV